MKTSQYLSEAYKLVNSPSTFTQFTSARDKNEVAVNPESIHAVCFCSVGALRRVAADNHIWIDTEAFAYLDKAIQARFKDELSILSIAQVNDSYSKEELITVWKDAISMAKTDEEKNVK